ncbi:MAG: TraM recognition domain-containing protein, partial [Patescibacteria group bacterium]
MEISTSPENKFKTPEEEVAYLREKIATHEKASSLWSDAERTAQIKNIVGEYKKTDSGKVLSPEYQMKSEEKDAIVLNLKPEAHDKKMEELLSILLERGIKNALDIVEKLDDPHIDDDFHRFLVQYYFSAGNVKGLSEGEMLFRGINMKLYRIGVPRGDAGKEEKLKEYISRMEQFYAGMLSISDTKDTSPGKNYFTLELALPDSSSELAFYAAVPRDKTALFEKQFLAFYPGATLTETTDDYNVFVEGGATLGALGVSSVNEIFPIKTFDHLEHDSIDALISAFAKLEHKGEGAALQFLISPAGDYFIKRFGHAVDELSKGFSLEQALPTKGIIDSFARVGKDIFSKTDKKKIEENLRKTEEPKKRIKEKLESTIVNTNIRIIVSAASVTRAKKVLSDIASSFNQLREPEGNGITFEIKEGRAARRIFHEFSYRLFSENMSLPLNLRELATIFHMPFSASGVQVAEAKAKTAPAPLALPSSGTVIGINKYQGKETTVRIESEDRMRHFYIIGQTGTGKTVLLKNMAVQDILAGNGVCMIDPHGSDLEEILGSIPDERIKDVIYFDPGHTERPLGLNMLEYDPRYPEQKTFLVNELLAIFNKLFDMKIAGGPAFEQYFRNASFLVMDHPESGNTLLDIARVMSDKNFRNLKLSHNKNPLVIQFWQNAERTTGEQGMANFVPYITNKFDVFLSNDIMRPIVAQEKSAFNFRDIMDEKKILLVNLSKGRLGDINSSLLGLIIVGKLLMAALSRADMLREGKKPNDFYLYIDEFQNVTTDSISTILSEARKYRMSLTVAHQYIAQLEEKIKNAVFGNVGSMAVFRVGQEDAEYIEKQFAPVFTASDITNLENRKAYAKLLINNEPQKPFNIHTLTPPKADPEKARRVREFSHSTYGKPREEVEKAILEKFN